MKRGIEECYAQNCHDIEKLNTRKNRLKPHWETQSRVSLYLHLCCEFVEFSVELVRLYFAERSGNRDRIMAAKKRLCSETCDLRNIPMMINDNSGGL